MIPLHLGPFNLVGGGGGWNFRGEGSRVHEISHMHWRFHLDSQDRSQVRLLFIREERVLKLLRVLFVDTHR